jgi:hypothetical protein
MITATRANRAGNHPTIQWFQQAVKCGTTVGHGRPQNHVWQHDFDQNLGVCLPCIAFPYKNPGQ